MQPNERIHHAIFQRDIQRECPLRLAFFIFFSASVAYGQFTVPQRGSIASLPSPASNFAYVAGSVSACVNLNTAGTSCPSVMNNTPAAGHLRYLTAFWEDSGSPTITIVSTNGDVWSALAPGKLAGTGTLSGFSVENFEVFSSVGGSDTVTMNTSVSVSGIGWETTEYSYAGSLSSVDGTPVLSQVASSGSIGTTASVTTTRTSDVLIAACPSTVGTCSVGSGWTARNDTNTCDWTGIRCNRPSDMNGISGLLIEDKVGVTAGTYTATFGTTGATDNSVLGLVAF